MYKNSKLINKSEGDINTLLLDITTFEPEKTMELNKRWEQVENMDFPKGLKIINQWVDAGGGRVFTVYNVETIEDYLAYNLPFTDLCKVEVFPVIEAGDFRKVASECIERMSKIGDSP
jgi:hypothetical protein